MMTNYVIICCSLVDHEGCKAIIEKKSFRIKSTIPLCVFTSDSGYIILIREYLPSSNRT